MMNNLLQAFIQQLPEILERTIPAIVGGAIGIISMLVASKMSTNKEKGNRAYDTYMKIINHVHDFDVCFSKYLTAVHNLSDSVENEKISVVDAKNEIKDAEDKCWESFADVKIIYHLLIILNLEKEKRQFVDWIEN